MSRRRTEVRTRIEVLATGEIEIIEQTWHGEDMTAAKRIFIKPDELAPAMRKLGWTPPVAGAVESIDPNDAGRLLAEIAGDGPQSPMIAFIEPDRVLVGGTINQGQAQALTEFMRKVKK